MQMALLVADVYLLGLGGTLAPERRASDSPIAIACFGFVTFLPPPPLFSLPSFISRISFSTYFPALGPYLRPLLFFFALDFLPLVFFALDFLALLFWLVLRDDGLDFFEELLRLAFFAVLFFLVVAMALPPKCFSLHLQTALASVLVGSFVVALNP